MTEQLFKSEAILSEMEAPVPTSIPPGEPMTERRGDRNERRKARTLAALLASARHLFGAQGAEATTIAEIAEGADIAIGSFYNYFRTKEDLLAALLEVALTE